MNGVHLHLIVTHLPVLGVAFGTVLLGVGLWRKSRAVQQTALSVLVLAGLAAGLAFLSGEGAEEAIEETLAGGKGYLERHEAAGLAGLIAAGLAGGVALIALAIGRRGRPLSRSLATLNLIIALFASGILAWVANLGGKIGHPEIRSGQVSSRPEGEDHDDPD
jgi:hypothetical protein